MTMPRITDESAALIRSWIVERGGVQVWDSANLADPGYEFALLKRDGVILVRLPKDEPTVEKA